MLGVLGLPKLMFTKWNSLQEVRVVISLASSIAGQALDSFSREVKFGLGLEATRLLCKMGCVCVCVCVCVCDRGVL